MYVYGNSTTSTSSTSSATYRQATEEEKRLVTEKLREQGLISSEEKVTDLWVKEVGGKIIIQDTPTISSRTSVRQDIVVSGTIQTVEKVVTRESQEPQTQTETITVSVPAKLITPSPSPIEQMRRLEQLNEILRDPLAYKQQQEQQEHEKISKYFEQHYAELTQKPPQDLQGKTLEIVAPGTPASELIQLKEREKELEKKEMEAWREVFHPPQKPIEQFDILEPSSRFLKAVSSSIEARRAEMEREYYQKTIKGTLDTFSDIRLKSTAITLGASQAVFGLPAFAVGGISATRETIRTRSIEPIAGFGAGIAMGFAETGRKLVDPKHVLERGEAIGVVVGAVATYTALKHAHSKLVETLPEPREVFKLHPTKTIYPQKHLTHEIEIGGEKYTATYAISKGKTYYSSKVGGYVVEVPYKSQQVAFTKVGSDIATGFEQYKFKVPEGLEGKIPSKTAIQFGVGPEKQVPIFEELGKGVYVQTEKPTIQYGLIKEIPGKPKPTISEKILETPEQTIYLSKIVGKHEPTGIVRVIKDQYKPTLKVEYSSDIAIKGLEDAVRASIDTIQAQKVATKTISKSIPVVTEQAKSIQITPVPAISIQRPATITKTKELEKQITQEKSLEKEIQLIIQKQKQKQVPSLEEKSIQKVVEARISKISVIPKTISIEIPVEKKTTIDIEKIIEIDIPKPPSPPRTTISIDITKKPPTPPTPPLYPPPPAYPKLFGIPSLFALTGAPSKISMKKTKGKLSDLLSVLETEFKIKRKKGRK